MDIPVKAVRDSKLDAKEYVSQKQVPQLFESITAGLLHHRPNNPIEFVQECLENVRDQPDMLRWNTFIDYTPSARSRSAPGVKRTGSEPIQPRVCDSASPFKQDHKVPAMDPSKKEIESSLNQGYTQYTEGPEGYTDYADKQPSS